MQYKFQSYLDISTSADSLTMIKVAVGGRHALQRVKHLIGAYKYFKLGQISIKLLPASTLPVDPLGLSYANDDPQTVDPRDQMNPGLVRITNGEDILDDFTGMSAEAQEQMYTNTMLDPRWSKFMLQSGFQRRAVPLYWQVGQLAQDVFPGSIVNAPRPAVDGGYPTQIIQTADGPIFEELDSSSSPRGLFQVGHRGKLGWLPTDALYDFSSGSEPKFMPLPSINVITVILPKAYKTLYYYRMFITETIYLSGLKNTGIGDVSMVGDTFRLSEYRAVDNFMFSPMPQPSMPNASKSVLLPEINDGAGDL